MRTYIGSMLKHCGSSIIHFGLARCLPIRNLVPKKVALILAYRYASRYHREEKSGSLEEELSNYNFGEWDRGGKTRNESLTPLYASIKKIIEGNVGSVCLAQVGSFYELYFEQAEVFGPKLGLKVATRKTSRYSIPMAGFPINQLQKFVKILVQDIGTTVAIIDQYPSENQLRDTIIHRRVSRIISPGTLVDETFLNYNQNNYLLALYIPPNTLGHAADVDIPIGLSWIDLSVGDFYVQSTTLGNLTSDISRINPSEIVISKQFQQMDLPSGLWYPGLQQLKKYFLRYHKVIYKDLKIVFKTNLRVTRKKIETYTQHEEAAMNMILSYISYNLPDREFSVEVPNRFWNGDSLQMDSRTREALELTERTTNGRHSSTGSLFSTIRRTVTSSGTRLLTKWIKSPILDKKELCRRQEFVSFFKSRMQLMRRLRATLSHTGDMTRSLQKLSLGTGDIVTNLHYIADDLFKFKEIKNVLSHEALIDNESRKILEPFLRQFEVSLDVAHTISSTLIPLNQDYSSNISTERATEGTFNGLANDLMGLSAIEKYRNHLDLKSDILDFSVRRDYTPELDKAHNELEHYLDVQNDFLSHFKNKVYGIDPKLNVIVRPQYLRYSNILQVSGKANMVDECYYTFKDDVYVKRGSFILLKPQKWNDIQISIREQIDFINSCEKKCIENLRLMVIKKAQEIRNVNRLVDYVDITSSFALLAEEYNLVCPKFVKSTQININDGRHIVVENGLKEIGGMFTPNDTKLDSSNKMWVISGPNMGGKSTFLRQNALIVILAQIGSFIPATSASLGIVDKIFTRIGASDDIFSDMSTFMVEMIEISNILRNATPNSLAVVDEIGRGTSGKEGLAIAYAALLYLLHSNKCFTLFATHFAQEIKALLSHEKVNTSKIGFYRTKVVLTGFNEPYDGNANLIFDHKLEPGISERSYALEVAKKAGFPDVAIKDALEALKVIG